MTSSLQLIQQLAGAANLSQPKTRVLLGALLERLDAQAQERGWESVIAELRAALSVAATPALSPSLSMATLVYIDADGQDGALPPRRAAA